MADETKVCKYCQTEIPKKAKICPNCKKKQGPKVGLIIVIVIVLLIIIGAASGGSDEKTSKIDNSNATDTSENTSTENQETEATDDTQDSGVVEVGGSFEDNGLKFTVNGAELDYQFEDEYGWYALDDGYVYLKVDFTFENTGDSDKYVSIYDFDCYADNTACEQQYVTDVTGDFINENISSGRNVSFTTLYAVPADASSIELEYTSNVWTDEKVIVKIK